MKYFLPFLTWILTIFPAAAQNNVADTIAAAFSNSGITGTFVLYDLKNDNYLSNDFLRAAKGYLPASTFKIFNSLAALETGAVKNEEEIIKWDSIPRTFDMWNMDHNLRSAIKYSVVWFYQELARRIGGIKMQYYLDKAGYGNRNIKEGVDVFWLEGDFKITAMEQIAFLKKLYFDSLPFSLQNTAVVKDIMIKEKTDDYTIRGKTGWAGRVTPQTGWYVGYVEKKDNIFFFAMNMDIQKDEDAVQREKLSYDILRKLNIIK